MIIPWALRGFTRGRVSQTAAPTQSAPASGDGSSGGDDVVHEIHRQYLHGAGRSNYRVFLNGETRKTVQAAVMRGIHGAGAANGTLDSGTRHHFSNGLGQGKVRRDAAVARRNWHQPARPVNERGHCRGGDLDGFIGGDLQIPGGAARFDLVRAGCAIAKGDVLGGVCFAVYGYRGGLREVDLDRIRFFFHAIPFQGFCEGDHLRRNTFIQRPRGLGLMPETPENMGGQ